MIGSALKSSFVILVIFHVNSVASLGSVATSGSNYTNFVSSECKNFNAERISFLTKELYTFSARSFPSNVRELDAFHKRTVEIYTELRNYFEKCLPGGLVRMFAMRTLNEAFNELRTLSDTSNGTITDKQLNFMTFSKCYNPLVFDLSICIYSGINYVLDSFKAVQTLPKVEYICCNVPIMTECMAQVVRNTASAFCTPNEVHESIKYIYSYRGDPLQVLCKNFDIRDKETCAKYETYPKYSPSVPYQYFYYLPLLESLLKTEKNNVDGATNMQQNRHINNQYPKIPL